jgi:glutamine amidotransferase
MIVVVDYGLGNLGSIRNMFKKLGVECLVTGDPALIGTAGKIVLPGVGAFDRGMAHLEERGLVDVLNRQVLERRIPVLGICLGMQLFSRRSEEGVRAGLGWIAADTVRFRFEGDLTGTKVPHMGWNEMRITRSHPVTAGLEDEARFYFVHSFHLACDTPDDVLGWTRYAIDFPAAIARDNLVGVQFHPEKSHRFGMQLLKNFAAAN